MLNCIRYIVESWWYKGSHLSCDNCGVVPCPGRSLCPECLMGLYDDGDYEDA